MLLCFFVIIYRKLLNRIVYFFFSSCFERLYSSEQLLWADNETNTVLLMRHPYPNSLIVIDQNTAQVPDLSQPLAPLLTHVALRSGDVLCFAEAFDANLHALLPQLCYSIWHCPEDAADWQCVVARSEVFGAGDRMAVLSPVSLQNEWQWCDVAVRIPTNPHRVMLRFERTREARAWSDPERAALQFPALLFELALHNQSQQAQLDHLQQTERQLRMLLEASEEAVWIVGTDHILLDYNTAFFRLAVQSFGTKPQRRTSVLDLHLEPETHRQWQSRYARALADIPGVYHDAFVRHGETIYYEVRTQPIRQHHQVVGAAIYCRNVTESYHDRQQLTAQNLELKRLNHELDRFVYRASHDIRAPLASLLGLVNVARLETEESLRQHYYNLMAQSIEKLDGFTRDVIDVSGNAREHVRHDRISFERLIEELIHNLRFMPHFEHVQKEVKVVGQSPFYTDEKRLRVILHHLIDNALRYSRPENGQAKLRVSVCVSHRQATIEVADNGTGIGPEHLEKIFQMFYRATDRNHGSGLGLYIVKETLDKIRGRIDLHTVPHEGCTFTITLPDLRTNSTLLANPDSALLTDPT